MTQQRMTGAMTPGVMTPEEAVAIRQNMNAGELNAIVCVRILRNQSLILSILSGTVNRDQEIGEAHRATAEAILLLTAR